MSSEMPRYAIGEFGTVYKFTGNDVPAGTSPLIEADGTTLTKAGLDYCHARRIASPNAEVIRVLCDKYYSSTLTEAAVAHDKNLDLMDEKLNKTKAMSERLRLDWEAQDKAYKASQSAKK